MHFTVAVEGDGPTRLVRLRGECDMASAPALQETLQSLRPPDVTVVVVDASELDFLDSAGLGVLAASYKRLQEDGGEFRISDATEPVRRVLEVSGLDKVIPMD